MDEEYNKILDKNAIFNEGKPLGPYFYDIAYPVRQEQLKNIVLALKDKILKIIVEEIYLGAIEIKINFDFLLKGTIFGKTKLSEEEVKKQIFNWLKSEKIQYHFYNQYNIDWLIIKISKEENDYV